MLDSKITSFTKFMILLFLVLTLMIAKSLYLIILFTIFISIILILVNYNVNKYKNMLKNVIIWLLFVGIIYIIVYGLSLNLLLVLYKTILIFILLDIFSSITTFDQLNSALYVILSPLKLFNKDVYNISFKLTLDILFIKKIISFDNKILEFQTLKNKYKYNVKNLSFMLFLVAIFKEVIL